MKTPILKLRCLLLSLSIFGVLASGQSLADSFADNCYEQLGLSKPQPQAPKALYVFVDQTMTLNKALRQAVIDLVSQWGNHGERVTISRFSANIGGQFTELMFDKTGAIRPDEAYLFQLRHKDKKALLSCLNQSKDKYHTALLDSINATLKRMSSKLPKTNLLESLNLLATQLVAADGIQDKTVLLVSDGLENSDVFSFYYHHKIKLINPMLMMDIVREKHLIPNWHGARIFMLGLGYINDKKYYARPNLIRPLKQFWSRYFTEGKGKLDVNSIGMPMLLTKSIL